MADENQTPEEKLADLYARVGRIQAQDDAAAESATTALGAAGLSADAATYAVNASVTAQKYAAQINKGSLSNPSKPNGYKVEIIGDTGKELQITRQDGVKSNNIQFKEDGNITVGETGHSLGHIDMWKAVDMHNNNVTHGAGRALFTYSEASVGIANCEMSGRGFFVKWGTGTTAPTVINLDSYTIDPTDESAHYYVNGDPFLKFSSVAGGHSLVIECTKAGASIKSEGGRNIIPEETQLELLSGGPDTLPAISRTLKHNGQYRIEVREGFDLSGLTLENPPTTITSARLMLVVFPGSPADSAYQKWPINSYWVDEATHSAPVLADTMVYHLLLENDGSGKLIIKSLYNYPLS